MQALFHYLYQQKLKFYKYQEQKVVRILYEIPGELGSDRILSVSIE